MRGRLVLFSAEEESGAVCAGRKKTSGKSEAMRAALLMASGVGSR